MSRRRRLGRAGRARTAAPPGCDGRINCVVSRLLALDIVILFGQDVPCILKPPGSAPAIRGAKEMGVGQND